jgi:hypothetical protein
VICRSLDGVNVASVFVWGIWTDDVEETPFGRFFRGEAWLVTVHDDAPVLESYSFHVSVSVYFFRRSETNRRKVLRTGT